MHSLVGDLLHGDFMREFVTKERITKGWSDEQKYCVTDSSGEKFLLRISKANQFAAKQTEFVQMEKLAAMGLPICLPLEFGQCEEGVYSLQSWIDGEDAEHVIPKLSVAEQYRYGVTAGEILSKIHRLSAPDHQPQWESRFNAKIDRKIKGYLDCPLRFSGSEKMVAYLNENRHLLKGRPQSYQHGDYHIGNMMLQKEVLYVIDFNRSDFGDPWEEFNRIVWCAQLCPSFACGMVDGYFHGAPPLLFWQLLALYISSNTLSSIYWAIPFGEKEIQTMMTQAAEILSWYQNMENVVPTWYSPESEKKENEKR